MKFIELNNTKLEFFDSEVPYIACDGIVNINPFQIEAVVDKYLWGKDKPFTLSIKLLSGRYYDVMFSSTYERTAFTEKVKNIILDCYMCCNKEPVADIVENEESTENQKDT